VYPDGGNIHSITYADGSKVSVDQATDEQVIAAAYQLAQGHGENMQ
jgi:hypothetical protein